MFKIGEYSIEELRAAYFDEDALMNPPYALYRMDGGDNRYYYTIDGDIVTYFVSATSIIKSTTPTSPHLIKWMLDTPNHDYERDSRAAYGTLFHIEAGRLLIDRKYDLDLIGDVIQDYTNIYGYRELAPYWFKRLGSDLIAFNKWIEDYNVKPLAVEPVLADVDMGIAGAVDLLCKLQYTEKVKGFHGEVYKSGAKKGEPKETYKEFERNEIAIVDFKTGENFYPDHEIQLGIYKRLVEKNFDVEVDKLYNWKPKKWRGTPTYDLKDQTNSRQIAKIPLLIDLWKIDNPNSLPKKPFEYFGMLEVGKDPSENFNKETLEEMIIRITNEEKSNAEMDTQES